MNSQEIYETQAHFNKWLKDFSEHEKDHVIQMMDEAAAAAVTAEREKLSERIAYLEERDRLLTALEEAGVDNWEGYDEAINDLENVNNQ